MAAIAQATTVELGDRTIQKLAKAIAKDLDGLGVIAIDAHLGSINWDAATDIADAVGRMLNERAPSEPDDGAA